MAYFTTGASVGRPGQIHATKRNEVGTVREASDFNSYIYLKGVTSCVDGSVVVFQPGVWTASLVASGKKGSVAIATAAVTGSEWGWFTYIGQDVSVANSAIASNVALFAGGVAGGVDDVAVKGDQIMNMWSRNAAAGSQDSVILQIDRAFIGVSNESTG